MSNLVVIWFYQYQKISYTNGYIKQTKNTKLTKKQQPLATQTLNVAYGKCDTINQIH